MASEEWANQVEVAMGGPLSALNVEKMIKNPHSLLNKTLGVYLAQVSFNEMQKRWASILDMIIRLKQDVHERVTQKVVVDDEGKNGQRTTVAQTYHEGTFLPSVVFPPEIAHLQAEVKSLANEAQALSETLEQNKQDQRHEFDRALTETKEKLEVGADGNNTELEITEMTEVHQEKFSKDYAEKTQNVDKVVKMSTPRGKLTEEEHREELEQHRVVVLKAVDYQFELALINAILGRVNDEYLKPSQVKVLSQGITRNYVERERKNHEVAQKLYNTMNRLVEKEQELLERVEIFFQGYVIPQAPAAPKITSMSRRG